jgi:hypothetical protein
LRMIRRTCSLKWNRRSKVRNWWIRHQSPEFNCATAKSLRSQTYYADELARIVRSTYNALLKQRCSLMRVGTLACFQWCSQPDNLVPLCKFKIIIIIHFISLEIDCFHSQWTRKYLHSGTKSSGWLRYCLRLTLMHSR